VSKVIHWILAFACLSATLFIPLSANEVFEPGDIPLLKNRFRIDHGAKQVTFLIYRVNGSNAAILVRPNGSKIFPWKLPENVRWLETNTVDIITIENPMPGPWQAVAETDVRNRIQIISDIHLDAKDLPAQVYANEYLKVSAKLINKGRTLKLENYLHDSIMRLTLMPFVIAENPKAINKEAYLLEIGSYSDNAKEVDERPGDGIFTALAKFSVQPGRYQLRITTRSEVFVRAHNQTVLVYPVPVSLFVLRDEATELPRLTVKLDKDELDLESVLIVAEVKTPAGVEKSFSIRANGSNDLEFALPITDHELGTYLITGTMYAVSRLGRDIMLQLPEKRFKNMPPQEPLDMEAISAAMSLQREAEQQEQERHAATMLIVWIVVGIITLILLGFATLFLIKRRKLKQVMAEQPILDDEHPMEGVSMNDDENIDLNMPD